MIVINFYVINFFCRVRCYHLDTKDMDAPLNIKSKQKCQKSSERTQYEDGFEFSQISHLPQRFLPKPQARTIKPWDFIPNPQGFSTNSREFAPKPWEFAPKSWEFFTKPWDFLTKPWGFYEKSWDKID